MLGHRAADSARGWWKILFFLTIIAHLKNKNDDTGSNSSSGYIFEKDAGPWTEKVKLTATDAAAGNEFGKRPRAFGGRRRRGRQEGRRRHLQFRLVQGNGGRRGGEHGMLLLLIIVFVIIVCFIIPLNVVQGVRLC